MGRPLTAEEFLHELGAVRHTAFRLELQPVYREPGEAASVTAFLGGRPADPFDIEGAREWYDRVAGLTAQGGRMERVRVQDVPPTPYQRWERWLDRELNAKAGEVIRYMTRAKAYEVGLLPAAGDIDWWLLDSHRLILMHFDAVGSRVRTELVTDPVAVVEANRLRDVAVHYSAPLRRPTSLEEVPT